jgi:hypothetical protein
MKQMKTFAALALFGMMHGAWGAEIPEYQGPCRSVDAAGKCQIPIVSFINLISTPERFHQREIVLTGYAVIAFEGTALGFTKDAGAAESLWLVYDDAAIKTNADVDRERRKFREWQKKYNRRWVMVEGVFDMTIKGHGGMYPGGIRSITQIELTGRR